MYVIGLVGKHATTHHTHPVFHINDRHVRHAACVNSVTCLCALHSTMHFTVLEFILNNKRIYAVDVESCPMLFGVG